MIKVDAKRSPELKAIIKQKWELMKSTNPKPEIYWKFIDEERNNILKEYKINAGQGIALVAGEEASYSYTIKGGHFDGYDQREIVGEAIKFWEQYLKEIEYESRIKA